MAHRTAAPDRATSRRLLVAVLLCLAVLLSACGSSEDAAFPADGSAEEPADAGWDEAGGWDQADDDGGFDGVADRDTAGDEPAPSPGSGTADLDGAGPQIIRTAVLTLEVRDATTAADDVTAIARERGGYVAESDLERDAQGVVRGTLVLRVPSGELDATVEALDDLAVAVPVRRVEEADVTGQVVDLRAQIANLTTYEAELNALLSDVRERTSRTDDLLQVFQQVQDVRSNIDRLQAQLDALSDRVALSTVTVTLRPAPSAIPVTDPTWSPGETVREALSSTVDALTSIADVAIRVVLTVLPILMVLAFPTVVTVLVLRRVLRRRRPDVARPADSPPPPLAGVAATADTPDQDTEVDGPARG
jgi:hypothetical protein